MKEKKRIAALKKAGVAVCDGTCAGCARKICTGAKQ
jgi:hypothetical protein